MRGAIISIEGLDGSGKHTQAKLLAESLGWQLRSFPTYNDDSPFSQPVTQYLRGALDGYEVNPYAICNFFAIDRYHSYLTDWGTAYEEGFNFIFDRYTESNIICQLGSVPTHKRNAFISSVRENEHYMGLPQADMIFFLDVLPEIAFSNTEARSDETEIPRDINEVNRPFFESCREAGLYTATIDRRWNIVKCYDDNGMLSVETIHEQIFDSVKSFVK